MFILFILGITFGLDVLVSVLHLMCMLYLSCTQTREDGCCNVAFKCCLEVSYHTFMPFLGARHRKNIEC